MAILAVVIVLAVVLVIVIGFLIYQSQQRLYLKLEQQANDLTRMAEASQNTKQRMESLETRLNPTISRIDDQLGSLRQSTGQMLEVGKDIASLEKLLRPPQLRGGIGEMFLEQLLELVIPNAYERQYEFRDGKRVDAVIKLGTSLVPVDAKFPMPNFERLQQATTDEERRQARREFVRDVKRHVDEVVKYIRPAEGTLDFAMMYIPAENVYYEVIVKGLDEGGRDNLQLYALERHVIPVSPNSFYGYLQAIVLGLRGLHVEERAREIMNHLMGLGREFGGVREHVRVLGVHLKDAASRYSELDKGVDRFGGRLEHLALPLAEEGREALPEGSGSVEDASG